jgi:hypothetical protein
MGFMPLKIGSIHTGYDLVHEAIISCLLLGHPKMFRKQYTELFAVLGVARSSLKKGTYSLIIGQVFRK